MLRFATMTKVRAKLNFVGIFTPDQPNDAFVVPLQCIGGIPEWKPHEQSASSAVERSPQSMEKRSAALNRGLPRPGPAARRDPTLGFSRPRPARITSHIGRLLQIFEWVGREQQRLKDEIVSCFISVGCLHGPGSPRSQQLWWSRETNRFPPEHPVQDRICGKGLIELTSNREYIN